MKLKRELILKLKYRKYFLTCNKENARPQSKASSPQPERREWLSRHVQLILCPRACADLGHPRPAQRPAKGHAHTLDLPRRRSFPNCKKTINKFIICEFLNVLDGNGVV